jgi:flagellar biosynthesis/type III secretory pathway chaperone
MSATQPLRRPAMARQADTAGSSGNGETAPEVPQPQQAGKDYTSALISVVEAAQHLCHLLDVENAALREHRFVDIEPLQERKAALTRLYEQGMKQIAKGGAEAMKSISKPLREQVMLLAQRLDELAGANGRLLKASIEANQRVLKAVVDATRKHQVGGTVYDREGALGTGRRKNAPNVAVSVNKTL